MNDNCDEYTNGDTQHTHSRPANSYKQRRTHEYECPEPSDLCAMIPCIEAHDEGRYRGRDAHVYADVKKHRF